VKGDAAFVRLVARVVAAVDKPSLGLELPLDVRGTALQERVWQHLRGIPAGETRTYAQIASQVGSPRAVRAVAGACAANRIAVAIPLPSRGALGRHARRLSMGRRAQGKAARRRAPRAWLSAGSRGVGASCRQHFGLRRRHIARRAGRRSRWRDRWLDAHVVADEPAFDGPFITTNFCVRSSG